MSYCLNSTFLSFAPFTIASARGCSELFSALAASCKISFSSKLLYTFKSVRTGFPFVIVPVLSSTTVFILCAVSRASPLFISIPFSAPFPVPTIIDVGVASPNAHGHAITRTDIKKVSAAVNPEPLINHIIPVTVAIAITIGTKYPATISAILEIGAFDPCASSTNFIICESTVSFPISVASNCILPFLFILPPITLSPGFLLTGMLSPVIIDSSTEVFPFTIFPSTAIFSPGFTTIMSPTFIFSIRTSFSIPFSIILAFFGCNPINFFIAEEV